MIIKSRSDIDRGIFELATLSDDSLVTTAKEGCQLAYAELFRRHRDVVYRVVQRITKNQYDTEDALQDAWLKAFVHINGFDRRSKFSTWLSRIAINSALMMLRKQKRFTSLSFEQSGEPFVTEPVSSSSSPEETLLQAERQLLVRQAIRRLPVALREVTELMHKREGSMQQAALNSELSLAAIKARLHRAKRLLRPKLQSLGPSQSNP